MSERLPKATQNRPYVIQEEPGKKAWCACGLSQKQPYCDGSHRSSGSGITPVRVEIEEKRYVSWCACRRTKTPPYCDGSHASL